MAGRSFSGLHEEDLERLNRQRAWVSGHFIDGAEARYADMDEKLRLIEVILREGWITTSETWKLQSLGVAFGDALAQKLGMVWMIVEDEYGRDPTLKDPTSNLNLNPLTMISKLVERGETVDIQKMFHGTCSSVEEIRVKLRES